MNSKKKDFQDVQNALRLKRHEHPPQRFFRSFPDQVIDRINSPLPGPPRPWYERLGFGEDWKPLALCVVAAIVCLAVAVGLLIARHIPPPDDQLVGPQPNPAVLSSPNSIDQPGVIPPGYQAFTNSEGSVRSTTPVLAPITTSNSLGQLQPPPR